MEQNVIEYQCYKYLKNNNITLNIFILLKCFQCMTNTIPNIGVCFNLYGNEPVNKLF